MEPESRLHPLSPLFIVGATARAWIFPGLLALVAARKSSSSWEVAAMWLAIPYALHSLLAYFTYRWRLEPDRLVIRSGLLFRKERQIPLQRIHNVDALQGVFHRLVGVASVRLETGGSDEAEATLRVISMPALARVRAAVAAVQQGQAQPVPQTARPEPQAAALELGTRDTLLVGLIENRGGALFTAVLGSLWELGLLKPLALRLGLDEERAKGIFMRVVGQSFGNQAGWAGTLALSIAFIAALLVLVRLASLGMAWLRWGGFRLRIDPQKLDVQHGLLTRIQASIPRRRIQALAIESWPLHRLFQRASIRVETAGSASPIQEEKAHFSGRVAPLVASSQVSSLVTQILPQVVLDQAAWQAVPHRAVRRMRRRLMLLCLPWLVPMGFLVWKEPRALVPVLTLALALLAWCNLSARKGHQHLGWALSGNVFWCKHGWWRRQLHAVPLSKVQAVVVKESPMDRRAGMATLALDIAGGETLSTSIEVPYLDFAIAKELQTTLAADVRRTQLAW